MAPSRNQTIIIVKLVVLNKHGEVLLIRRSMSLPFRPGEYDFPGGIVNPGEGLAVAVCRETREETGLEIPPEEIDLFYGHTEMVGTDTSAVRLIYRTHLSGESAINLSREHTSYEWVPLPDVPVVFPHPMFKACIKYAQKYKLFTNEAAAWNKLTAKAAVIREGGDILLMRRSSKDTDNPGRQDFPGGGVETGEDPAQAVRREISEEAGINIDQSDIKLYYAATEFTDSISKTRLVYYALAGRPEVNLSFEHDDYHWVLATQVSTEFKHRVWTASVDYAFEHNLFS